MITKEELDRLTTNEMNKEQWSAFREDWLKGWAQGLEVEAGLDPKDAYERAELYFEEYCGQEGYTARDERIRMKRDGDDTTI